MGCDCKNVLPAGTNPKDVEKFLASLGYERFEKNSFYFHSKEDYKSLAGVEAYVSTGAAGEVVVFTHTKIWRNKSDSDFHNSTIRQLKSMFGGHFISDYGRNRYLRHSGVNRTQAEAGCYVSYFNLEGNISRASYYLMTLESRLDLFPSLESIPLLKENHPLTLSVNLVLPLLVSTLEEYFKSTFVALLRYSERKPIVLRNSRVLADDLLEISNGKLSVEEGVARTMSFQNISKISSAFRDVDQKTDIAGILKRPYRRRKESLYETLDRVFEQRHSLIHQNRISGDYTLERAKKDIASIRVATERVYSHLIDRYSWTPYDR